MPLAFSAPRENNMFKKLLKWKAAKGSGIIITTGFDVSDFDKINIKSGIGTIKPVKHK